MSTFLVVLDGPVSTPGLCTHLLDVASTVQSAQFVLLRTTERRPGESEEEARIATRNEVAGLAIELSRQGVPIMDAISGDALPRKAIAEAIGSGRTYDGLVLATADCRGIQPGFDPVPLLERRFHLPVISLQSVVVA